MADTLDLVLSDERITFVEAIFLLQDHFKNLSNNETKELILDLGHVFMLENVS